MHQFKTHQLLPISISEAWSFFSSPENLSKITPPEMDFKILTPNLPNKIYNGMLVDYMVKPIFGIKMKWKTEIMNVTQEKYFIDKQLVGPYSVWEHKHLFEANQNGVLMTDIVNYKLPFGLLGKLIHFIFIRRKIESIFEYRKNVLLKLFQQNS